MAEVTENVPHIVWDDRSVAWIDDSNVKVIELALDHLAYGWSAEALHEQFPHLSLAQIYAALACYYDREADFLAEMAEREERIRKIMAEIGESPVQARLRRLKVHD
jgi:uncharacterized protein (DUF433 family)